MHAVPFLIALVGATVLAPPLLRALEGSGHVRENYRARKLPYPLGVLSLIVAALALVPVALLQRLGSAQLLYPQTLPIVLYALGVLGLGLLDDTLSLDPGGVRSGSQRGWRGHGAAAMRGELSTGVVKAGGSLGLALIASSYLGFSDARWVLSAAVLVLATNVFNLLDLRPGRSTKAFVLLGAGLAIGAGDLRALWALGLFAAPALVAGGYDLRERAMLGDSGASLLGALAGLWLILTLSGIGQLVALAVLGVITVYGELRSISALVERTPVLRGLDSWGRPT